MLNSMLGAFMSDKPVIISVLCFRVVSISIPMDNVSDS